MKNIFAVILLLIITSEFANSQDMGVVSISIGAGFPSGEFASKDLNNTKAGLAKRGGVFDLSFGYRLGKNLGLAASLRSQGFEVENQTILNGLNEQAPDVSWTVESESWGTGGLFFGGYGSFPIGSGNTSFETKAMLGLMSSSSPQLTIDGELNGITETAVQESKRAGSFGFLMAVGFKFNISNRVCIVTNLDYLTTSVEFKDVHITGTGGSNTMTFTQPISAISFTAGLGIRLGNEAKK